MAVMSYGDAVNDALQRLDGLGYERGEHVDFANHGPMGAETVAVLGHTDEVARWVEGYRQAMSHHEPPTPRFPLDATDEGSWRPALGAFDRAGDWEQLFARELGKEPWQEVLTRWWPRLLPGLFAGLTHGVIRTAHAVRSLAGAETPSTLQLTELARGLAYWAARFTALPGQARFGGQRGLTEAIRALPRPPGSTPAPPGERLRQLGDYPGYAEALQALAPQRTQWLLSEMTTEFAGVYLAHPEVFPVPLIHGVTAPAAVRLVVPHIPDELHLPSLAALWQVHTALLLAFTSDQGTEDTARTAALYTDTPAFDELVVRAVEHGDEHVIKFTEACQREHALRPDPRYPAAVLAAHQRIPPRTTQQTPRR
jgi:hypothetical protein